MTTTHYVETVPTTHARPSPEYLVVLVFILLGSAFYGFVGIPAALGILGLFG